MPVTQYNGIDFDSQEEVEFYMWLQEAQQAGYIFAFYYHPPSLELVPRQVKHVHDKKGRLKEKFLFHPLTYQPDFRFLTTEKFQELGLNVKPGFVYVDIKGAFEPSHSKTQVFSMIQKLVYHKHGIYVHKIVPRDFFKKTWVPAGCAFMSNRRALTRRKPYAECRLLREVI